MVLDIDETALSNWIYEDELDFGYSTPTWKEWVERVDATAIAPTLELYRYARDNGLEVFFITGRRENERKATEQNLVEAGYADWEGLTLKPDEYRGATTAYKSGARQQIVAQGYRIVLNVGDQKSDLEGGHADRTFLLPNPFYGIP
jgi:predicted secreted acid phosphatase